MFRSFFFFYKTWVPLIVVTTGVCFLVYVCCQQVLRQSANDPQIQMAEDGALAINNGRAMELVVGNARKDLSKSLAPFTEVFGSGGEPMLTSGVLNSKMPVIPFGVLGYAKKHGENRLTWEPQPGVRIATVVVPFKTTSMEGFIVSGRSLREVENREEMLTKLVFVGWTGILIVVFVKIFFLEVLSLLLKK